MMPNSFLFFPFSPCKATCLYPGEQRKRLDAAMRQSHAVHLLREISHQQQADIELMKHEIARLMERSRASFAVRRPVQPDIIYS